MGQVHSDTKIRAIRNELVFCGKRYGGLTQQAIAKKHGVSQGYVSKLWHEIHRGPRVSKPE